ncbi:hypothetical protein ACFQO1_04090 [Jejudonia soesokkakensis]|uniref:Uncharacterized protein n=1 Tax=Jejudonia soesokkakensis TaxID=1323432 RepID=A0ABW2MPP4_9FLAO
MMKIVHIVNPVNVGPASDLFKAQPITFESMRKAKEFSKGAIEVALVTTQYSEDHDIIPAYFYKAPDLKHSVMDVDDFKKTRKLPFIKDILDRAVESSLDAEYIVYTNVDIALLPHFYLFVKEKIEIGLDAFVINRRTISKEYDLDTLASAYSDLGVEHPGFDCFVIRKDLIASLHLGSICIGANWIGRTMFANLITYCNNYELFKYEHLTFHIGEDGAWLVSDFSEFDTHNKKELYRIINELKNEAKSASTVAGLQEIKSFMDNYGLNPMIEKPPYNPNIWTRLKKKIKKGIKIIFDKN